MSGLVGGFGDGGLDAPLAQQCAVRARGVGLVAEHPVGPGAWSTRTDPLDAQLAHQRGEHRRIATLARADKHDQRSAPAIDELVDLGREPPRERPRA